MSCTNLKREITNEEIGAFDRDGIICLRGIFKDKWVDPDA